MRKNFISFSCIVLCAVALASCLGNNDDDTTYYDDTAITSFSLGTLKYKKRVNADSVANTTLSCSGYKFYIDQQNRTIYNTDSLPVGVDASRAVCTIITKNAGTVILKDNDSDSLSYWSSTDSIDFTKPRKIRVYNNAGSYREYTVSVNVHKEYADTLSWTGMAPVAGLSANTGVRLYATSGHIFLLGNATAYVASRNGSPAWTQLSRRLGQEAYRNAAVRNDSLFVLSDGKLLATADGQAWSETPATISRLLGASTMRLYAVDNDGKIAYSSDGKSWTRDDMDAATSWMPASDLSFCTLQLPTNDDAYRLLLCGNRERTTGDTTAVVWGKIEETNPGAQSQPWSLFNTDATNHYSLPALANVQVVAYDNMFVALGGAALFGRQATHGFYRSSDNGITWHEDITMALPKGFTPNGRFAIAADKDNYLWIADATTGNVWRGRINRLGWVEEQKGYYK